MAKAAIDRTTIDLFETEKQRGRPKSSPYSREQQVRINKKNQLMRDKQAGLKRVEIKLHKELYDKATIIAEERGLSRSELLAQLIDESIQNLREG
ncbi:LexA regulated protein [Psychrosphaera ytuae]|uniref:LexA regulated protein n=1 Tax=Psychrosphaera ytuae TaxID=2820710 RepID=A0A975HII4_9GAMM|nr:LexA regulated protein [Psychrosphaera ytuae]QTH64291.1 LexA regulated protein [Psychrosphaera ytuae]